MDIGYLLQYVCNKNCGVDTVTGGGQIIFLCKLCSEKRETLKKSGAWFYQTMPKYVLPEPPQQGPSLASPGALPRRRLPTPPVGNGQRPAVSPTPSGRRQLPKWAEAEPQMQRGPPRLRPTGAVKKGIENGRSSRNSSSEDASDDEDDYHRPTRRMIIQPRKFQSGKNVFLAANSAVTHLMNLFCSG